MQLPRLNILSGIGLLAEIRELEWFDNSKQLVVYAGLATSVRQSTARERPSKITKQRRKRLRGIVIHYWYLKDRLCIQKLQALQAAA